MRVIVGQAAIAAAINDRDVPKLHRLLGYACEGRHEILSDTPDGFRQWLARLDEETRNAYSHALDLSTRTAATHSEDKATIYIVLNKEQVWGDPTSYLPLDEALTVLQSPLAVLVENANADWNFLLRIMRASERAEFDRSIARQWITPLHGGGAEIVRRIEARSDSMASLLRTFAIFDSDRRHPDELHADWRPVPPVTCQGFLSEAAARDCLGARYWRLNRRSIESYLPRFEIEQRVGLTAGLDLRIVEAFFRLPAGARWYFNMKRGLAGDRSIENAGRAKLLYDDLDVEDRALLENGFGRNLAIQFSASESKEFDWDLEARKEAATALPRLMRLL